VDLQLRDLDAKRFLRCGDLGAGMFVKITVPVLAQLLDRRLFVRA